MTITAQLGLRVGFASHTGQVRELNEDSYLVLSSPALDNNIDAVLVVADGMGGHQAGEVASAYLVQHLEQLFSSSEYEQIVYYSADHPDYFAAVLKEVLEQINEQLYSFASEQSELRGMGTTATVALISGQRLFLGHVGDSRAYRVRNGELHLLTEDHSWVAEQVREGKMTAEEAASHPRKNVLTRVLGHSLVVRVDRSIHEIQAGDHLVLCSDGLTNFVHDAEIQQAAVADTEPQAACDWLVNLANERGGGDNITVVMARFTSDPSQNQGNPAGGHAVGPVHDEKANVITQKILREKTTPKRKDLSEKTKRWIWFTAVAIIISLASGAFTYVLLSLGIEETAILRRLPAGWAPSVVVFVFTLIGILVGLSFGCKLMASGQDQTISHD